MSKQILPYPGYSAPVKISCSYPTVLELKEAEHLRRRIEREGLKALQEIDKMYKSSKTHTISDVQIPLVDCVNERLSKLYPSAQFKKKRLRKETIR